MFVASRRDLLGLCLASLWCGCAAGSGRAPPASAQSPLLGKPLPTIKRRTLTGESLDSNALAGRVVVVKFFAEYCAPCKKTLPAAQAAHVARPEVTFIGVSEDEHSSTAEDMVRLYALSFPVIHDSGQVLSGRFRVSELPATFVAGKDGIVRWVGGEHQDESALGDAIDQALR